MALSVLKDIRKMYAGLNAEGIRKSASRDFNVGLMAGSAEDYRALETLLAPEWLPAGDRAAALRVAQTVDGSPVERFDFILAAPGMPIPKNGYGVGPGNREAVVREIVADHSDLELALGKSFPLFRRPVADRIIQRVSRENALFSLTTALPNVIPSVVDLPWAVGEFATDTAFLTLNQVRMALLMAAAHGHAVGYAEQKGEIAAIAAGAFGWRALARELVGKIPLGGGLIPKAAIAFAGTYVVGLGLEKVNRTGSRLSRREQKDAYADAFAQGKAVVKDLAPSFVRKG
ncbi:MAG: hypothetical protein M3N93_08560 [Acidobacteriota bacterium]|nr:hypothetical protein [Acidobacteriota bacterium]